MKAEVTWRVLLVAGGHSTSVHEYGEKEVALAAVREVAAGLGAKGGCLVKLAPGLACWQGPEAGGWCLLLWRHMRAAGVPVKPKGRRVAAAEVGTKPKAEKLAAC